MTTKRQAAIAFVLGLGALAAVFFGHLALARIYRGVGDLDGEWRTMRFCLAAIVAVQVFTLATLWRVFARRGDDNAWFH